MEILKGIVRIVVTFTVLTVALFLIFIVTLVSLPPVVAVCAFDADTARYMLAKRLDSDPVADIVNAVLRFALRLAPDRPVEPRNEREAR